ncbi:glycosyltransferase family 9 protein [Campylobacter lari]|uniref:glycosyltransferase family 9 protein n=1 Tax=Campylobacter lari TaxID=201 RepID=UPI000F70A462|nr:glycosyltransferase family 9 protein [Campylobacter lari]MCR6543292.1 glycosyltransferase family 9 protein [Campylobacter lari]VEJ06491.1 TPR repeat-containing protein [Campylobacter lari]
MYARCLEKLCQIASKVLFAPQSAMYEMFKNQLKELNKQNNFFTNLKILKDFPSEFDYAIPICSLPLFCDIKLDEISKLRTPIIALEKPNNKIKKIGIFWFTPNAVNSDLLRNIDFVFLFNTLSKLNYKIMSFQIDGIEGLVLPKEVENRGVRLKNWSDTLENLKDIDCMISIDSAIAHLTLALNIPTIVLLAPRFDWRWGKFENQKSCFWPRANLITLINGKDVKKKIQNLLKNQFNA